jgi:hypothetical protein
MRIEALDLRDIDLPKPEAAPVEHDFATNLADFAV